MKIFIISLGGSLIHPDNVDFGFLKRLKNLIYKSDHQFVLYCGGGALARRWQKRAFFLPTHLKDWLGIFATRVNATIVKNTLKKDIHPKIITNPTEQIDLKNKILICAGWKPGWSTDFDAVLIAKNLKANTIINMSNISHAYTKDPNKFKNAKKITKTNWKSFRKIVGNKWSPGLNMPFDPIASRQAQKQKTTVHIIGNNLNNLSNLLKGKKFIGTTIKS